MNNSKDADIAFLVRGTISIALIRPWITGMRTTGLKLTYLLTLLFLDDSLKAQ
jgi:hypothetical protein